MKTLDSLKHAALKLDKLRGTDKLHHASASLCGLMEGWQPLGPDNQTIITKLFVHCLRAATAIGMTEDCLMKAAGQWLTVEKMRVEAGRVV